MEPTISGVGVLDKSMSILEVVAESGRTGSRLSRIVTDTGLPKPTAHRLATALETHGLLRRVDDGRYVLGAVLVGLGRRAETAWPITEVARPILAELRRETGESTQLYVRDGDVRVCLISFESAHELRTTVDEGSRLTLEAGSAGRILRDQPDSEPNWLASVGERQAGVASVSAAVTVHGEVVAAVGISGPIERLGTRPGRRFGPLVASTARRISRSMTSRRRLGTTQAI